MSRPPMFFQAKAAAAHRSLSELSSSRKAAAGALTGSTNSTSVAPPKEKGSKKKTKKQTQSTGAPLNSSGLTEPDAMSDTSNGGSHGLFSRIKINRRQSMENIAAIETRRPSQGRRPSLGGSFTSIRLSGERRPSMDYQPTPLEDIDSNLSSGENGEHRPSFAFRRRHSNDGAAHVAEEKRLATAIVAQDAEMARNSHPPAETPNGTFHKDSPKIMNATNFKAKKASKFSDKTPPKVHPVVEALVVAMEKDHMMDITLCGKEGVQVKASRYVLACRNEAFELLFYKEDPPAAFVNLGEYNDDTLKALVVYCFTGSLTKSPVSQETADAARGLVQLADLARIHHFRVLFDEAYQMARTLMNRKPSLACAFYDEASGAKVKDFETYALQTIEDFPIESLLGTENGIRYLSYERLGPILSHREMEVDEMTVFWMLKRWVEHHKQCSENTVIAKKLASKINLKFIEATDLLTTIRLSGFFEDENIDEAIAYQAMMASNRGMSFSQLRRQQSSNNENRERVVVTGAGDESVNGTYYREIEERDESSVHFTKEGNGALEVFGLYLWGNKWGIASEIDLSNTYYQCERTLGDRVPEKGWITGEMGRLPSPICTWMSGASSDGQLPFTPSHHILPPCFASEEELYGN
jgi:BTB/POZ domain